MGNTDGVLHVTPENNMVYFDLAILKYIDDTPINKLYWDNDLQMTINKNFIIDLYLALKIEFHPGQLGLMRRYPSEEITFVKQNGRPGWFQMTMPTKAEKAEALELEND